MTMNNDFLVHMKETIQNNWEASGFQEPTAIQSKAIPIILAGNDLIAQSPTGTGKTVAYLLPILQKIEEADKGIQAVILAPSRELVMQIYQEVQVWSKGSAIRSTAFVGGANIKRQMERLKERPQVVVGTPGRVLELIRAKKLKMHEVKTIVLDEGDRLLSKEHLSTVRTIVKSALNDRQLLLFSATKLTDVDQFKAMIGREPTKLTIGRNQIDQSSVDHYYILCEPREKTKLLQRIANIPQMKGLVFVRSVGNMNVLADRLTYEGVSIETLHSDLGKQERERALNQLHDGTIRILLATDVAARGLDIEGLTHVIHYDLAEDADQYIHRSGRTGRMGAAGTVVSLVNERDERELKKYGRQLNIKIEKKRLYKGGFVEVRDRKRKP